MDSAVTSHDFSSAPINKVLSAEDKLLRFFDVVDQYKRDNLEIVFAFLRIWYADEVRLSFDRMIERAP